ncbi:sensor histidine kinase [Rheinheimera gaetbuli]
MRFDKQHLAQMLLFGMYTLSVIVAYYTITERGTSALTVIAILLSVFLLAKIKLAWNRQSYQIKKVLLALTNEDPTLGLPLDSPLLLEFNKLKNRIEKSRNELHIQNHFFESLIQHLDAIVLVIDENNTIIHKNSASEVLTRDVNSEIIDGNWGELGEFIIHAGKSAQRIITWKKETHTDTLTVRLTHSLFLERSIKIVIIQSIHKELVDKELDTYKRLTKVLIHEVSNSVTPISMLTHTTGQLLPQYLDTPDEQNKEDIIEALSAIQNRVTHLSTFVSRFMELSSIPMPNMQYSDLKAVINNVLQLLKKQLVENGVRIYLHCAEHEVYKTNFDAAQIEQVLLNIIKNGIEALESTLERAIHIKLYYNNKNKLFLDITDDGPGIPPHVQEKIFIPFFTTKPNGSGIGLSLSKQIMRNHNGDLLYVDESTDSKTGACFRFIFD